MEKSIKPIIMLSINKIESRLKVLVARERKVMEAWCSSTDTAYRRKSMRISVRIYDEISKMRKLYWQIKEEQEALEISVGNEPVLLTCRGLSCEMGMGMSRKRYTEIGEVICDTCGKEMLTDEDWRIKEMLWSSGISTD